MEINRKARRSASSAAAKAKRVEGERAGKGAAKKAARAADTVARRQDQMARRLRDELDGSGAPVRVRELVADMLGPERTPAADRLLARLQSTQRVDTSGPYGP